MQHNTNILNEDVAYLSEDKVQPSEKFIEQKVCFENTPLFFPKGYENIFLAIYVIFLPYIVGIIFLFLYAAKAQKDLFVTINKFASLIVTWAVGYEIIAALIILYIMKLALSFSRSKSFNLLKKEEKPFRRPKY